MRQSDWLCSGSLSFPCIYTLIEDRNILTRRSPSLSEVLVIASDENSISASGEMSTNILRQHSYIYLPPDRLFSKQEFPRSAKWRNKDNYWLTTTITEMCIGEVSAAANILAGVIHLLPIIIFSFFYSFLWTLLPQSTSGFGINE